MLQQFYPVHVGDNVFEEGQFDIQRNEFMVRWSRGRVHYTVPVADAESLLEERGKAVRALSDAGLHKKK